MTNTSHPLPAAITVPAPWFPQLFDWQAQDRVVVQKTPRHGAPEETVFVEAYDSARGLLHTLTVSGSARVCLPTDVVDVIKAEDPVLAVVAADTWRAHGCDPFYAGKPVRAIAALIDQSRRVRLVVSKYPGVAGGHLYAGVATATCTDHHTLARLPMMGFNPTRFHDADAQRCRDARTAGRRVAKFIAAVCAGARVAPPKDLPYRR